MAVRGLEHSLGWWNRIITGDFNGDGRPDFVLGNLGLNSRLHASPAEPARMYVKDFDGNGFPEQVLTVYERVGVGAQHAAPLPLPPRDELTNALPSLKPRYPKYSDYAGQTVDQGFARELKGAASKQVRELRSAIGRRH